MAGEHRPHGGIAVRHNSLYHRSDFHRTTSVRRGAAAAVPQTAMVSTNTAWCWVSTFMPALPKVCAVNFLRLNCTKGAFFASELGETTCTQAVIVIAPEFFRTCRLHI